MAAGFEKDDRMAFRRKDGFPWHHGGGWDVCLDGDVITAEEMAKAAELDWEVTKWPLLALAPLDGGAMARAGMVDRYASHADPRLDEAAYNVLCVLGPLNIAECVDELAAAEGGALPKWSEVVARLVGHLDQAMGLVRQHAGGADGSRPLVALARDHLAVTRVKNEHAKVLGVTSPAYRPFQNRELFEFCEALLGAGNLTFVTAGSLNGGKRVWVLARYRDDIEVPGLEGTKHRLERYLLISNGHDGSAALRILYTTVNVVCQNTLNAALSGAENQFSARHTASMTKERVVEEARRVLDAGTRMYADLQHDVRCLLLLPYDMEQFEALAKTLWPATIFDDAKGDYVRSTQSENIIEELKDAFLSSPGNTDEGVQFTGYAALQAFTYWATHLHSPRIRRPRDADGDWDRAESEKSAFIENVWMPNGHGQAKVSQARRILLDQALEAEVYTPLTDEEKEGAIAGFALADIQRKMNAEVRAEDEEDKEDLSEKSVCVTDHSAMQWTRDDGPAVG